MNVKAGSLKYCFCISVFCHAVVFGIVTVAGFGLHKPMLQQEEGSTALTLVAAPEEPVGEQSSEVVEAVPPVTPVLPSQPQTMPAETTVPTETVEQNVIPELALPPQQTVPLPQPEATVIVAKPERQTNARGDGTSEVFGQDATTSKARPELKAEPNYLTNPELSYPLAAKRRHQEGVVLLAVKVTSAGHPAVVALKQSSGFPLLDEAAIQAVRNWEFVPAKIGSVAVESEIEVPVRFELVE